MADAETAPAADAEPTAETAEAAAAAAPAAAPAAAEAAPPSPDEIAGLKKTLFNDKYDSIIGELSTVIGGNEPNFFKALIEKLGDKIGKGIITKVSASTTGTANNYNITFLPTDEILTNAIVNAILSDDTNRNKFVDFASEFSKTGIVNADTYTQLMKIATNAVMPTAGGWDKKMGGADVGSLAQVYNTSSLVTNDHPPSAFAGSPEVNSVAYAPAAFSAGSSLNQDLAHGLDGADAEGLNPVSVQVAGSKKTKKAKKTKAAAAADKKTKKTKKVKKDN